MTTFQEKPPKLETHSSVEKVIEGLKSKHLKNGFYFDKFILSDEELNETRFMVAVAARIGDVEGDLERVPGVDEILAGVQEQEVPFEQILGVDRLDVSTPLRTDEGLLLLSEDDLCRVLDYEYTKYANAPVYGD